MLLLYLLAVPGGAAEPEWILGLDVSHHSGKIDWATVADSYDFVYAKATEGVDDADPMFETFWQELKARGIPRGAYHFYVTEDDPEEQARFFLSRVRPEPGDLPPVVDVELIGKGTTGDLATNLKRFLVIVEDAFGVKPIIYTGWKFWNKHIGPGFGEYPLWVAEYGVDDPLLPKGWERWHLWQFEGNVVIPGVEKHADRTRVRSDVQIRELMIP